MKTARTSSFGWPTVRPLRTAFLFLAGVFLLATGRVDAAAAADEDDAIPVKLPGLIATYRDPSTGVEFTRYEAIPAFQLAAGESPDPRLPASGWQVRYSGVIDVLRPGKYQFASSASGRIELKIDDKPVALPTATDQAGASPAIDLSLGLHPISIEFAPAEGEPAKLQIFWQCEVFDREQMPSQALGHATDAPAVHDAFLTGRLLVEDHNCAACHQPSDHSPLSKQLEKRPAPRLTKAGARLKPAWIYHWLAEPQSLRPEATMPQLFPAGERGDTERYAVAHYLASQGGPVAVVPAPPAEVVRQAAAEGALLFQKIGCAVCHERQGDHPARVTLKSLGQKTTPEAIEAFLQKPSAIAPAGRMPEFVLGKLEKHQLAAFLVRHDAERSPALALPPAPTAERVAAAFAALAADDVQRKEFAAAAPEQQLLQLGWRVIEARNCAACHELKPMGEEQPLAATTSKLDFAAIAAKPEADCLGPRFGSSLDRAAAGEFLHAVAKAPAPPAPAADARAALARFNCQACHDRDGLGGLTQDYINRLGSGDNAAAELVTPPSLTQVTQKLTAGALRGVLERDERSRPWMSLQMPRFGKDHMAKLPVQLAALDAGQLADAPAPPAADTKSDEDALAEAGRTLVGSRGFGCTKCHDMLGIPSSGTRGPDLANVTARVNRPWYERWMKDPQRIQQGTRMPTVFLNGESPYKDVLGGDPARQREAIWHYLTVARSLPPPEGLEPEKLERLAAGNRPVAVRTFLPDTTPRGIAVRFPNQVHAAFDAQTCRTSYAWNGEFLDMAPVWNGRGGKIAHILGTRFWTAPAGCPWEITPASAGAPSFVGRGDDPALGALVKDSKLHPSRLSFLGYQVDEQAPTFRYRLAGDGGCEAGFVERVSTIADAAGSGLVRDITITAPSDKEAWLHVADVETPPQWVAGESAGAADAGQQRAAASCSLRVEQAGRPVLLRQRSATSPTVWVIQHEGDRWQVLLKIPAAPNSADRTLSLAVRGAADGETATWSRLLAEEMK